MELADGSHSCSSLRKSLRSSSSWTRFLQACWCAPTGAWRDSAENCGFSAVAVHRQGRRYPYCGAEADPHGSVCSGFHRDSPVARHGVDDLCGRRHPCRDAKAILMVLAVQKTIEIPEFFVDMVIDVLIVRVVQVPQVASWR